MAEIALRTAALAKRFGGLAAVDDVSIEIAVGEIHALIGPNGAGKTTLVNLLSGDLAPSGGDVFLGEKRITALAADKRGKAGLGRSYQITTIFPAFSVFENVRLAVQAHAAAPLAFTRRKAVEDEWRALVLKALRTVGLVDRETALASALSHGEQRQLEIAMVVATDPKVVLLDEPLAGMGQAESHTMIETLKTLRRGRAILLVEHDMDAVFAVADRLSVMQDGRIIASGAPADVRRDPAVRAAYLGAELPPS